MNLYKQKFSSKKENNNKVIKKEIKERSIYSPSPTIKPIFNIGNIENSIQDLSQKIVFLQKDIQQIIEVFPDLINTIIKNQSQLVQQPIGISYTNPMRKKIIINRDLNGQIVSADLVEESVEEKEETIKEELNEEEISVISS
jgi:hypothetical protein